MNRYLGGISTAFLSVTTLFFVWGFVSSNNDPLIAALKASFALNWTEALATQLVFFAAYGVMSLPAAALLKRLGALRTILVALSVMIIGCVLIQVIVGYQNYTLVLAALFILGIGITTLQVSANPLASALGPPESSHFRLTFAQAFNSLGVVIGANFGSKMMLGEPVLSAGHGPITDASDRIAALQAVSDAFSSIAALLAALMVFIWISRHRINAAAASIMVCGGESVLDALKSKWAVFGAIAIGLYVGAEVSIGSIMINYLGQQKILNLPLETAGFYLANIYWMGALVGRFLGSYLLTKIAATKLLLAAAGTASILCFLVVLNDGPIAGYIALAIGLFNSIMFPTIFTITLERANVSQAATSGLLCLAIVGGAVLPYTVGRIADEVGLTYSFLLPMFAYATVALFGFFAHNFKKRDLLNK